MRLRRPSRKDDGAHPPAEAVGEGYVLAATIGGHAVTDFILMHLDVSLACQDPGIIRFAMNHPSRRVTCSVQPGFAARLLSRAQLPTVAHD